jgi:threonine aldolase
MDGARFANALVRLNASPAQMTWRSGIDVSRSAPPRAARWPPKPC